MENKIYSKLIMIIGGLFMSTASVAGEFVKTIPIKDKAELTIFMRAGDVKVVGWDKNQVKIESEKDLTPGLQVNGDKVRINSKMDKGRSGGQDADTTLHVPKSTRLTVTVISGNLEIENISDRAKATSVSGDIKIRSCSGLLAVKAVSGDVELIGIKKDIAVQTVSGDLKGRDIKGDLIEIQTVSGEVFLNNLEASQVRLKTVSGDLKIQGAFPAESSIKISTVSGDATLYLKPTAGFDVSLATRSGDFHSEFNLSEREGSQQKLNAKVGSGGTEITMTSLSGDLNIKKSD
ncbi:MAG: DUF4097 family beta strand repeat protein [Deltaproteobacteria bacterium]|nr:DUF4097 family beta strand repeat protein [Deltaproteobacteria bacterium]